MGFNSAFKGLIKSVLMIKKYFLIVRFDQLSPNAKYSPYQMLGHSSVRVFINSVHYNFDTPIALISTTAL